MSTMTVSASPLPVRVRPGSCAETPRSVRPSRPVRLTRRGRLLLTVAAILAGVAILGAAQPQALALGHGSAPVAERVTVRPGETLWAIAERAVPGADPRDTIVRIQAMNDLDSSTVPAGRVLLVPAG